MAPRTSADRVKPLDWDGLHVFTAVCEAGTVSGAAQRLGVNHSTVLRRLASLEQALAVRLFDRLASGYALTAAGNELAGKLAGVADQIESAQRHLLGLDEQMRGVIRLTTTDTLLHTILMKLVAQFSLRHPGVEVQVTVNNSFSSLTQREADVAVRGSNRPPENLAGRRVGSIQTALYASRDYLKTLGRRPDLRHMRFVAPDESLSHIGQARWVRKHVAPAQIAMRVDSLSWMVDAVAQGVGAGLLLCPLADQRKELVRLAPPDPELDTQIWILTHPDLRQVARIRAFTQHLYEALSADPRLAH